MLAHFHARYMHRSFLLVSKSSNLNMANAYLYSWYFSIIFNLIYDVYFNVLYKDIDNHVISIANDKCLIHVELLSYRKVSKY